MNENELSKYVVDCAVEVHRSLGGPGLLEAVYEEAMAWELQQRGFRIERQKAVPVTYKGNVLSAPLRLDLLVESLLIVEVKSITQYSPIFESQVLTYLRMLGLKLGIVINFGEKVVKDGIHRVCDCLSLRLRVFAPLR